MPTTATGKSWWGKDRRSGGERRVQRGGRRAEPVKGRQFFFAYKVAGQRTHRGEEAGAADTAYAAGEADALGGFWGHAAQAWASFQGCGGRLHDDAFVLLQGVRFLAGLCGLVKNSSQLVALVAAFRKEAGKVSVLKIPVAEVFEEFPDLHKSSDD
jgi:hypothetical protein